MSHSLFSMFALSVALALAAPTAASADVAQPAPHLRPAHHVSTQQAKALSHKQQLKIEGLRRNPKYCAKYGCVGNN
jgi:hypothetical protein